MTPDAAAGKRSTHPTGKQPRFTAVSDTSGKARLYSFVIAWAIRLYCLTLRFRIDDRGGMHSLSKPVIWAIWHNRLFPLPVIYLRIARDRCLSGLTSPSTDGAILSAVLRRFGIQSVRGSSNKRAAQSLVECRRRLLSGSDLAITPDGPRGPRCVAAPGVVQLARLTNCPLMPVKVDYSSKWQLKSWDRFQIPRPFARVTITVLPPMTIGDGPIEDDCRRIEELLGVDPENPPPS